MNKLGIVFAGTPEFTLPCLGALAASHHQLLAVYTQPDRPAGRGMTLQPSAAKNWALAHQIPVYQPLNFKNEEAFDELAALKPDLMVVIAYGLILPQKILSLPRLGCINVHASLLPRWRGASPIQQAILHGDQETGVTIMQMDAGMDTGDKLEEVSCPISPDDTAGTLHDKLAHLAITPLLSTIDALAAGVAKPKPQDNTLATYAAKIKKEDAAIDWQRTSVEIDRQIRAFNPWPIAHTKVNEEVLRVHRAHAVNISHNAVPGTILALDKKGMLVATAEQALMIEVIQFPGGKAMTVGEWLNAGRSQLHVNLVLR
ncbi:methionyl-tRNA formyltransferase [Legionella micdadei]|uniref:Methionyl-tRNA formyltransferase n=1 Tax=Legionella micdadei TaxID=451 RepID=A0A098GDY7_LEGMI|nr:methionyl-tRNA formyltransferase [Legionella micdadei]ARG96483.1 methionyl-tRNA formyltransferase [Legionella micdadei]ARG99233.1 methionyl-tRNA formyltransferase [Legionella micdadei]KTD27894.1 methionyl tRNA formyltransferase [Legionella micdadei]CEG59701.1 Methionyl-tRNA formyltransferase [Legionella micdadei]SCY80140.1 methionyl-tRNA formyltransferase [Legionella micdadei]